MPTTTKTTTYTARPTDRPESNSKRYPAKKLPAGRHPASGLDRPPEEGVYRAKLQPVFSKKQENDSDYHGFLKLANCVTQFASGCTKTDHSA